MPNFRNPAPEAPVRTYPTPDITDQVLVEWVTSEEAFSRPLVPGTPHANTRDFSGFKLGKQDVNPRDNHWFIRYWVRDQPDPDFYNYAIKFSEESNLHPIIIRSYRELKDGYTPRDKESDDPNFPGAILVSEEAKQFDPTSEFYADYFNVIRVYETLPGPWTSATHIDQDGTVTVNTRRNLATAITTGEEVVTVGTDRVWRRTTKKDSDSVVTDEIVEERIVPGNTIPSAKVDNDLFVRSINTTLKEISDITPGASFAGPDRIVTTDQEAVGLLVSREVDAGKDIFREAASSTSIKQVIPDEFLRVLPTYTFSHRLDGTVTEPPVLALGELTRKEDQLDKLTFRRTTESLPTATLPITITNYELTERFGGGFLTVTLTLDTTVMTPEEGYLVTESFVREMHAPDPPAYPTGLYMKLTKHLAPPATQWPLLHGTHVDERYGVVIALTKQVLPEGITGGVDGDGTIREVKILDKWRSVQMTSKLNVATLPAPVTWFSTQRHSFPPELVDAVIDWAEGTCGCSDSFSAVLIANVDQYSGVVKTRVTEQFFNGVPPDNVPITQFCPQSHHFGFAWASACTDPCRTKSGAPEFHLPLSLHGDLTLSVGALHVWNFPATFPDSLPHGSYITLTPHVERWRFGVFRRVVTEVLVPTCAPPP
jgi:hypothetical protein